MIIFLFHYYFSHEEHKETQKNTKQDERRREIYIKETEKIILNQC